MNYFYVNTIAIHKVNYRHSGNMKIGTNLKMLVVCRLEEKTTIGNYFLALCYKQLQLLLQVTRCLLVVLPHGKRKFPNANYLEPAPLRLAAVH